MPTAASGLPIGDGSNHFRRDAASQPASKSIDAGDYSNHQLLPIRPKTGDCIQMIEVTRLNGMPMTLNSDLIKIAEASPDTMLTLIHGEKLIVRESCAEIVEKVLAYRASLLAAVATRMKAPGELHRVVAMASLSPESSAREL
jgi:flagellar protein FlbD